MPLPINILDLLKGRIIEQDRVEFKAGWNPDSIYRSICAFANDIENIDSGKILSSLNLSETLNESAMRVLLIIKRDPNITASEIAIELNISSRAAEKQIANLKKVGIIERIGSDKTGYWMVKSS